MIFLCVCVCVCLQLHGYRGKEPLGLQIFIGTADERILKPHAFYQVHRITGKTVTTTSFEKVVHGTKVLEIPLEPKNNMKAMCENTNLHLISVSNTSCTFLPLVLRLSCFHVVKPKPQNEKGEI